jgi:hypothetical protein
MNILEISYIAFLRPTLKSNRYNFLLIGAVNYRVVVLKGWLGGAGVGV